MMIDISKGYRQYSPKELLSFAYNGTLTCKGFELEDFLCYIVQEIQDIEAEKWEKIVEVESDKAFEEGVAHGRYEAETNKMEE